MAGGESFTAYCDSDEEVFIGKVTEKEWEKAALFGQNYYSPVVKSTPRSKALHKSTLPDVLADSTCTVSNPGSSASAYGEVDKHDQSKHSPSANSSSDEDSSVVILEDENNSVQIISDTDSLLLNEELVQASDDVLDLDKDNICLKKGIERLSLSSIKENVNVGSSECDKNAVSAISEVTNSENMTLECYKTTSTTLSQGIDALEDTNRNPSLISNKDMALENTSIKTTSIVINEDINSFEENNIHSAAIPICAFEDTNRNSSIMSNQDIDELDDSINTASDYFQPNSQISQESMQDEQSIQHKPNFRESFNEPKIGPVKEHVSVCDGTNMYSEMNSPVQLNVNSTPILKEKTLDCKKTSDVTNKSVPESEYFSLNGISDSVLDISHGLFIASPLNPNTDQPTESQLANVYEDISCDGETQFDSTNQSACGLRLPESFVQNEDLHMSVDEQDYHHSLQMAKSSCSSYHTAFNSVNNDPTSKISVDSFNRYRDTLNETGELDEIDMPDALDNDNAIKSETSFEIIVQKRQNSFTPSSPPAFKKSNNTESEQIKPKMVSKLPVYNHGSKGYIKPPVLNVTSQSVKSNYKWAKKLTKLNPESSKQPIDTSKGARSKKVPSLKVIAIPESQEKNEKVPNQVTCTKVSNKLNSPLPNKTPAKTPTFKAVGMVKAESKIPSFTPLNTKQTMSSEKKMKSKIPYFSQEKDRYKNVISPIRLYISGTTPVLQERTVPHRETTLLVSCETKNMGSHLPVRTATPLTSSRVVQKLKYEKKSPLLTSQQENMDPNCSRDTLPPRALENSVAVFMKEPEPPQRHLPKMGGNLQKLLDTPRPKVVLHQGRVKSSPTSKGKLVPNVDGKSPDHNEEASAARVSVRLVKTADTSNDLK